ncbi:UNVERIFIED_CONTAM: Mitochondrial uncoupling protein 5 [Sesamum radiatum]|uniref:Mitochondrial uncoupling protein 5 n=1 Tax=Sesamum radiatum TaxID=300843 RepID=A0AAW2P5U7_SESRA
MILERDLMKDGLGTHVTASFAAGFVAAVASNPVDVIKTRVMNMKVEAGMVAPYSGAVDCAMKTIKAEGPMALYKGFIPTISRQGCSRISEAHSHSDDDEQQYFDDYVNVRGLYVLLLEKLQQLALEVLSCIDGYFIVFFLAGVTNRDKLILLEHDRICEWQLASTSSS